MKISMQKWTTLQSMLCDFCGSEIETLSHIVLSCLFIGDLWSRILSHLQIQRPTEDWIFGLDWAMSHKCRMTALSTLYKLAFSCFIYTIWRERNQQIFQHRANPSLIVDFIWKHLVTVLTSIPRLQSYQHLLMKYQLQLKIHELYCCGIFCTFVSNSYYCKYHSPKKRNNWMLARKILVSLAEMNIIYYKCGETRRVIGGRISYIFLWYLNLILSNTGS